MAAAMPSSSRRRNSAGAASTSTSLSVSGLVTSGCVVLTVVTLPSWNRRLARHGTLTYRRSGTSAYRASKALTGGAHEPRDTAGWPITPALRAGRHRDRRSAVDDAPAARALRLRLQDQRPDLRGRRGDQRPGRGQAAVHDQPGDRRHPRPQPGPGAGAELLLRDKRRRAQEAAQAAEPPVPWPAATG